MRLALRVMGVFLVVVCLSAAAAYLYLRQSLPKTEGEVRLAGLGAAVEVLRDRHGIPHIYAASLDDAYFALGFVHAQDRLWQMEMNRRIGSGRLAEVLGPAALDADRFMRTLGLRRVAEANLQRYDAETRRLLDAYAAGVNAFLAGRPVLPPEFWILRVTPEPWSAADSIVWTKMMAWDLGGNWRSELLRMRLSRTLPLGRIQEFLAPYPGDAYPRIPDLKALYSGMEKTPAPNPVFSESGFLGGSNSWVVAGSRSASGKPLLAADPHLGLTAPPVWYFAHLHAPGLDAIGGTLPGVPAILVGRNDRIAWGLTNTGADVQDLYLEKLDTPFTQLEETIKVKDGAPERLVVRRSRHGPLISDTSRTALEATPRGYALALAWTALAEDDLTMQAALKLARARDWNDFLGAARTLHAPPQSASYADADGNIGFIAAGRVPVRKRANDLRGLAPAPGWDERYDWTGYVPFEALPRAFNPPSGTVILANHKIVPPKYRHHITYEWQPPYRARRIEELLGSSKHDLSSFKRIQADAVSIAVRELLPRFVAANPHHKVMQKLAAWDATMAADRAEPLIMIAWWREFTRALYADELGPAFRANWNARAVFIDNVLSGQSHWCDNVRTPQAESCDRLLIDSLENALEDLQKRYGNDWKWGQAHVARHRHRPFAREPWLARIFDIRVPSAGDAYTVNAGAVDFDSDAEPFANRHAPSLRAISDLADPQASVFIHSGGQSGNPFSAHYRNFAAAWARGEYVPMVTERRRLEADGVQRLVLTPRK
ncbi:MAG TPA: penicillin acylase family protein [Burkholderiales bacterium]|nr:penicillin acylase family protein [Burkholderiales bacterium]